MKRQPLIYIASAVLIGAAGALLSYLGNPRNTGICISCFMENYAGALKLHSNLSMQYLRPEISFILAGSFVSALFRREFNPRLSPALPQYFLGGFFMIVGSAVFIGCPIKMLLRLAGGDMNSIAGIAGVFAGVIAGVMLLRDGINTRLFSQKPMEAGFSGTLLPVAVLLITAVMFIKPALLAQSNSGPASERAPLYIAAFASLCIGAASQYSRFCVTGSIRNSFILKNMEGYLALAGLTLAALIVNIFIGRWHPGVYGQPGSHTAYFWSFAGMALTGYIAVIIDGCPFRQLVKSGEGDINSQTAFFGMLIGAAFVQSFQIYSDASGPTLTGKIGLLAGILIFALFSLEMRRKQ